MTPPESGRSPRPTATNSPATERPAFERGSAERDAPPPVGGVHRSGQIAGQRAKILHELVRVRRQAEAARLEAQASRLDASAEQLESLLERIDAGETFTPVQLLEFGFDETTAAASAESPLKTPDIAPEASGAPLGGLGGTVGSGPGPAPPKIRFESWDAIREVQSREGIKRVRQDGPHGGIKSPRMRWRTGSEDSAEAPPPAQVSAPAVDTPPATEGRDDHGPHAKPIDDGSHRPNGPLPCPAELVEQAGASAPQRRSTAVITSAVVHLVLLLCLAGFTLNAVMPKDQIALAASASEPTEETIQTLEIEAAQPESITSETTPEESVVELDPLGEMRIVEVSADSLGSLSTPSPAMQSFASNAAASSAAMQARPSDTASKMQFCGVEGGGNHFVYLVDSSGSMGDAFISARRALLESIDMLQPEQRFYVIFFDADCDYMRITRADQNESRSVPATAVNKQRLKSWAMRVEMDRGKAPYEPLEYALQKLKPDVIFLLSDGEFPQRIEDLLQEENKVTNLFGETKPISIIHTISYHSREGESRMRRIAESNFGQYRHVPKP